MTASTTTGSPMSVLRVGSSDESLSTKLTEAVVGFLRGTRENDTPTTTHDTKDVDDNVAIFTISNRYFDANVSLLPLLITSAGAGTNTTQAGEKEDGIMLVFDDSSVQSFNVVASLHNTAENTNQNGELLRLCIGVSASAGQENLLLSKKEREEEYSRRVLWCLDHGYEYIEKVDLEDGIQQGHNEREKEGFARIIEAIQGTVWSTAKMHPRKKEQLKQTYQETINTISNAASSSAAATILATTNNDTTNMDNGYEPPPTTLHIPSSTISEEESKEREEKARQALLHQDGISDSRNNPNGTIGANANVNPEDQYIDGKLPPEEDRQREQQADRIMNSMEGALKEAHRIRDLSRNGQLSDDERRQRAGDAAVLLMSLMNQMGGLEDESEDEGDRDTGVEE